MPKISKRVSHVIASPIRKFVPLISEAEKKGIKVYKLSVGDPDIATPAVVFQELKKYSSKNISYSPSAGTKEHIAAWQKYYAAYGVKISPSNIVPTAGGTEAMLFALLTVTDPGDEIIVFEPVYSGYKGYAALCQVKLVPVTTKIENHFALPPESEIRKKITKKTKAILIVNPSNPTGTIWSKKELDTVVKIANQYNLFILADETYREIVFTGQPNTLLQYKTARDKVILMDSASKRFSCPGARIGCLVSFNEEVMWSALKLAMIRLSVPTIEQKILIKLIANAKKYTKNIVAGFRERCQIAYDGIKDFPGVVCQKPDGAFYMVAKLPVKSSEDFIKFLITEFNDHNRTVIVTPMYDFYLTPGMGRDEIRIACVLPPAELRKAMTVLRHGLTAYLKK